MTWFLISHCKLNLNTHIIAKTAENGCLCFDSNVDKDKIFGNSGTDSNITISSLIRVNRVITLNPCHDTSLLISTYYIVLLLARECY